MLLSMELGGGGSNMSLNVLEDGCDGCDGCGCDDDGVGRGAFGFGIILFRFTTILLPPLYVVALMGAGGSLLIVSFSSKFCNVVVLILPGVL